MDENHSREVSVVVTAEPPETTRDRVLVLMANKQSGEIQDLGPVGDETSPPGCHQQRTETEWAAELAWDTISTAVK